MNVVTDRPTCVALWWKGSHHLLQFSLLKVGKGMELLGHGGNWLTATFLHITLLFVTVSMLRRRGCQICLLICTDSHAYVCMITISNIFTITVYYATLQITVIMPLV